MDGSNSTSPLLLPSWYAYDESTTPFIILILGAACAIVLLLTAYNATLGRKNKTTDILHAIISLILLTSFITTFADVAFPEPGNTMPYCHAYKWTRFTSYLLFQILCNFVLLFRLTVLLSKKYSSLIRWLLGLFLLCSLSLIALATVLDYDATICSMKVNPRLNSIGKLLQVLYFASLLLCFAIPFYSTLRYLKNKLIMDVQTNLTSISRTVLINISIPMIVFFVSSLLQLARAYPKRTYLIGFVLEDVSLFVCMSLTYPLESKRSPASPVLPCSASQHSIGSMKSKVSKFSVFSRAHPDKKSTSLHASPPAACTSAALPASDTTTLAYSITLESQPTMECKTQDVFVTPPLPTLLTSSHGSALTESTCRYHLAPSPSIIDTLPRTTPTLGRYMGSFSH